MQGWLGVDPKAELMMGYSPYHAMGNNPISFNDPEGDAIPLLALAFTSAFIQGSISHETGGNFFKSAGIAFGFSFVSAGIGATFGNVGSIGKEIGRASAHALSGGLQSSLGGGNFWQGALSGGLASGVASGIEALGGGPLAQIIGGGISGGVGAEISGGKFWQGFAQGITLTAFNHLLHRLTSGGPPWEYNGKMYRSKGELYRAILIDQAVEQFGIKDIVALAAALDGSFPSIEKRFSTPGSSTKTSYASKYGSKIMPQEMPRRLPTHINLKTGKVAYTKVLGRFVGRLAGPVGWGLLTYDIGKTLYNTQRTYNLIIHD